jgi:hypothetical protein
VGDADGICRQTEQSPRGCGFLVDQLNRAALSIAPKIAELIEALPAAIMMADRGDHPSLHSKWRRTARPDRMARDAPFFRL